MLTPKHDAVEMLGITPLTRTALDDEFIFSRLLSPTVRAMLGPITNVSSPQVLDTIAGQFPGDEANNLNDHRLYGGQTGYVRYPYVSQLYSTANGALVLKRDASKLKLSAWLGDVHQGKGELIHMAALRDRHHDGTIRANDCALLDFPYDHPVHHRRIHPTARSLELSIYSYSPGSRLLDAIGDPVYDEFVAKPFKFVSADKTELFLKHFWQVWKSNRSPGQNATSIKDVSKMILPGFYELAERCRYDFIEAAPSHYHVAMWMAAAGYRYTHQHDAQTMAQFASRLKDLRNADGSELTRSQQAWVCVLQNLKQRDAIPKHLDLGGVTWPQDNIGPQTLWVYKPVSALAHELAKGQLGVSTPADSSKKA